jgi:hypothetical protein
MFISFASAAHCSGCRVLQDPTKHRYICLFHKHPLRDGNVPVGMALCGHRPAHQEDPHPADFIIAVV